MSISVSRVNNVSKTELMQSKRMSFKAVKDSGFKGNLQADTYEKNNNKRNVRIAVGAIITAVLIFLGVCYGKGKSEGAEKNIFKRVETGFKKIFKKKPKNATSDGDSLKPDEIKPEVPKLDSADSLKVEMSTELPQKAEKTVLKTTEDYIGNIKSCKYGEFTFGELASEGGILNNHESSFVDKYGNTIKVRGIDIYECVSPNGSVYHITGENHDNSYLDVVFEGLQKHLIEELGALAKV